MSISLYLVSSQFPELSAAGLVTVQVAQLLALDPLGKPRKADYQTAILFSIT